MALRSKMATMLLESHKECFQERNKLRFGWVKTSSFFNKMFFMKRHFCSDAVIARWTCNVPSAGPPPYFTTVYLVARSILLNWGQDVSDPGAGYLTIKRTVGFSYYVVLKTQCIFWDGSDPSGIESLHYYSKNLKKNVPNEEICHRLISPEHKRKKKSVLL